MAVARLASLAGTVSTIIAGGALGLVGTGLAGMEVALLLFLPVAVGAATVQRALIRRRRHSPPRTGTV